MSGLLIILLAVTIVRVGMEQQANRLRLQLDAERVANKLAGAMDAAHSAGNGTVFAFYNKADPSFSINITGRFLRVIYNQSYASASLVTNATVQADSNLVNQYIYVNNSNGVIYVGNYTS